MTDLGSAALFRELAPTELQALRQIAQERTFTTGSRIFSENDPGDGVYVIRDGLVEIAHLVGDRALCVFSKFGPGEIFGEMAVIEDLPRSATTTAAKETHVYFIPRTPMVNLLRHSPSLSFKLLQEVSRRLRDFNQHHLREIIEAERLATVGNFARSIVHDLKNPLTVIGMAAEIMAMPNATLERRRESYARVSRQIVSINDLVSDILNFTQNAPVPTSLPLASYREFIETTVNELRTDNNLKGATLRLENEPPDLNLPFDSRRLRRVIFNLVSNAADMMPDNGQIIFRFQDNQSELIMEIQDTGPGIAPEIADKLFQTFVTYGKEHGTGLGLSICKKIIEDHRGRISARNAPGGGAIFSFTLPVQQT